jgi:hypothetical protein
LWLGDDEDEGYESVTEGGHFCGYKWQCVEYARRWLIQVKGITFRSIPMAYHIFQLDYFNQVSDNKKVPVIKYLNGHTTPPVAGDVLIWQAGGRKIG